MNGKRMAATIILSVCLVTSLPLNPLCRMQGDCVVQAATKKQFQLTDKQYKRVKGWWTENSSGGWNVKFTRSKVKYYDRETGKVAWTAAIKKCKKKGKIYIYYIQTERGKVEYRTNPDDPDSLDYYFSWDDEHISDYYSGSSSLSRGKWGN